MNSFLKCDLFDVEIDVYMLLNLCVTIGLKAQCLGYTLIKSDG